MDELTKVDIGAIKSHITTKKQFENFAGALFREIGESVKLELSGQFPGVEYQYKIARPTEIKDKFIAEYGKAPDVGWVAMSFKGYDLYNIHIGTLVDLGSWPITYTTGFHVKEKAWLALKNELDVFDWEQGVGFNPRYEFCTPNNEHMFNSPKTELNLEEINKCVEGVTDIISKFYRATYPFTAILK